MHVGVGGMPMPHPTHPHGNSGAVAPPLPAASVLSMPPLPAAPDGSVFPALPLAPAVAADDALLPELGDDGAADVPLGVVGVVEVVGVWADVDVDGELGELVDGLFGDVCAGAGVFAEVEPPSLTVAVELETAAPLPAADAEVGALVPADAVCCAGVSMLPSTAALPPPAALSSDAPPPAAFA